MSRATMAVGAAVLAAVLAVGACSNSDTGKAGPSATGASTSAPAVDPHNQADVTFAQQMTPHHRQAVEMSDMVLGKQGIDPRVVDLAGQIKAAQAPEIEQMQTWLSQWGTPIPSAMPGMPGMTGMDGMMSEQDMASLQNAQGVAASKLYLTQMVKHHQGAIIMAQDEINHGQFPAAIAMARAIVTSQQQEIDTMNKILASL
jgi:uncharacterized protein (DUF305 family)